MDSNKQIILDLQNKIGFNQTIDFLSDYKGVPVVIKGQIHQIQEESIIFTVEPPESICMGWDENALLLRDSFISGIQGRILNFDLENGMVELGQFTYSDRGFGERAMVRVEPEEVIKARLVSGKISIPCDVVDISLNGFGILTESTEAKNLSSRQAATLKLNLLNQEIEISGTLLGIFPKKNNIRMAISFSQDTPGYALVTRYITRRRAEIRQDIQSAYQQALGKHA